MDVTKTFQKLIPDIVSRLDRKELNKLLYLCKDSVSCESNCRTTSDFFQHCETMGKINPCDLSFLAEMLYRIKRHDLLQRIRDYEDEFFLSQSSQNFPSLRIACLNVINELSTSDFEVLRDLCKDKLSHHSYSKSNNAISLLSCLEEEGFLSKENLNFTLNCLRYLDNQAPYETVLRLSKIQTNSVVLPKTNQSFNDQFLRFGSKHTVQDHYNSTSKFNVPIPEFSSIIERPPFLESNQACGSTKMCEENFLYDEIIPEGVTNLNLSSSDQERTFLQESNQACCSKTENERWFSYDAAMPETDVQSSSNADESRGYLQLHKEISLETGRHVSEPKPSGQAPKINISIPYNRSQIASPLSASLNAAPESDVGVDQPVHYKMDKVPFGVCLIINNSTFKSTINQEKMKSRSLGKGFEAPNLNLKHRKGSENDVVSLSKLFKGFGFIIETRSNLEAQDMLTVFTKFSKLDHSNYNCFITLVMSHGFQGGVYGTDGMKVTFSQIQKRFKPQYCPTLLDKPKLFFFQACQGKTRMPGYLSDRPGAAVAVEQDLSIHETRLGKMSVPELSLRQPERTVRPKSPFHQTCQDERSASDFSFDPAESNDDIELDGPDPCRRSFERQTPNDADFFMGHSTVPGHLSYRSKTTGTWYINTLVKKLKQHHFSEDFSNIMVKVNNEVAARIYRQMPMSIVTLRKKIFFKQVALPAQNGPYDIPD